MVQFILSALLIAAGAGVIVHAMKLERIVDLRDMPAVIVTFLIGAALTAGGLVWMTVVVTKSLS